jgi:uncharacterized membrane protein
MISSRITLLSLSALLWACGSGPAKPASHRAGTGASSGHDPDHAAGPEAILAAEKAAYDRARPVFDRHCARCHTSAGDHRKKQKALPHFSMDAYPFGGHHATELAETIREVLGATGQDATMPDDDPGSVQGEELAIILAWADAFERSHAAGLHKGHGDGGHDH